MTQKTVIDQGIGDAGRSRHRVVLPPGRYHGRMALPRKAAFWLASQWQPGHPQRSLDKQFLRDWSAGLDWDRRPPGPDVPPEIVAATRERYLELYNRLTRSDLG